MRFIHDNLIPLLAALILIAAISCWFDTSVPPPPRARAPVAEAWSLPKLAEQDGKNSIDAINARNLWGIAAADAVIKEPEWHVLGIATNGNERFVLIAYAGKPVEILKVGDALPDGVKIVQIESERFFVMGADKKKLVFGIYNHDPAK